MLDGKKALSLANEYTKETVEGVGAIEGKPCQIQSITEITGGHRVTYLWVDNDGNNHTSTMDVMNGLNGADGAKKQPSRRSNHRRYHRPKSEGGNNNG